MSEDARSSEVQSTIAHPSEDRFDILRFFEVPDIRRLDGITIGRLVHISNRLQMESEDPMKQKMILQSLAKRLPKVNDNISMIDNIFIWLQKNDMEGAEMLSNVIDKDFYEELGKQTGNWRPFLRNAQK